jgi:hypothetical protein
MSHKKNDGEPFAQKYLFTKHSPIYGPFVKKDSAKVKGRSQICRWIFPQKRNREQRLADQQNHEFIESGFHPLSQEEDHQ